MSKFMKTRKRLALMAVAALVISGAVTAVALANITPQGVHIILAGNSKLTFEANAGNTVTIGCEYTGGASKTASPGGNVVTFSGHNAIGFHDFGGKPCDSTYGKETVTEATDGTWKLTDTSRTTGEITTGQWVITRGSCTITPTAGSKISGTFIAGKNSEGEPSTLSFKEVNVPITGVGCGTLVSPAKLTAFFVVDDGSVIVEPIVF